MKKIYDAHVHFDLKREEPYQVLKKKLQDNSIEKCLLILNSIEEEQLFLRYRNEISDDGIVSAIAAILDINKSETKYFLERMGYERVNTIIKIHPRLTGVKKSDFPQIYESICSTGINVILIDDFIYGPDVECHVGTELGIYLAQKRSDFRIVLAHAGGCGMLRTLLLTRPLKNIYYDYSLTTNYLSTTSVHQDLVNGLMFTSDRIMFGTDYPDFEFQDSLDVTRRLCSEAKIGSEQIEKIFYQNALNVYGGKLNDA